MNPSHSWMHSTCRHSCGGYQHPFFCECLLLYSQTPRVCSHCSLQLTMLVKFRSRRPNLLHLALSALWLESRMWMSVMGTMLCQAKVGVQCQQRGSFWGYQTLFGSCWYQDLYPVRNFCAPSFHLLVTVGYCLIQLLVTLSKMSLLVSSLHYQVWGKHPPSRDSFEIICSHTLATLAFFSHHLQLSRSCLQEQTVQIPPYNFLKLLVQNWALFHIPNLGKSLKSYSCQIITI